MPSVPSMLVSEEERAQWWAGGWEYGWGLEVCITSRGYACLPTRSESVGQGDCLEVHLFGLHVVGSTCPGCLGVRRHAV